MICNIYGDILVKPFEFYASMTGFDAFKRIIEIEKEKHGKEKVIVGIETTGHYYEDLVRRCHTAGYHVRIINAATTAETIQRDRFIDRDIIVERLYLACFFRTLASISKSGTLDLSLWFSPTTDRVKY